LGGIVLATVFSSAGPVFLEKLTGDPAYAPLIQYLRTTNEYIPIWAISTQDVLWQLHTSKSVFGGVSAMPSMHSAVAMFTCLTLWNRGALLRWLGIAHVTLIFLGSVLLGWHYAVDGYASWALAAIIWLVSTRIALWWDRQPLQQHYKRDLEHFTQ
jgi:membrane-associated phospholipid phosphatase